MGYVERLLEKSENFLSVGKTEYTDGDGVRHLEV